MATIRPELKSSATRNVLLSIDDQTFGQAEYSVTNLQYTLGVNAMPTAVIAVGSGIPLYDKDKPDNTAELLLAEVIERSSKHNAFINCKIYEVGDTIADANLIFKGVIVTGSVIYKAGEPSTRAVQFVCMHEACLLMVQVLGVYRYTCGSAIVNHLINNEAGGIMRNDATSEFMCGKMSEEDICQMFADSLRGKDISTRIHVLMNAIIRSQSVSTTSVSIKDAKKPIIDFAKYIKCRWKLDPAISENSDEAEDIFNRGLCSALMNGLQSSSAYDAAIGLMTSLQYMMNLIPRCSFSGMDMDFNMYLEPSVAWNANKDNTMKIPLSKIYAINSKCQPLTNLDNPSVFIVDYSNALPTWLSLPNTVTLPSSVHGIFTTDPEIEKIKNELRRDPGMANTLIQNATDTPYKTRVYRAPDWMNDLYLETKSDKEKDKNGLPRVAQDTQEVKELQEEATRTSEHDPSSKKAEETADKIAQAIYTIVHGTDSTATLSLFPSLRFGYDKTVGCLECHIGRPVDVAITKSGDKVFAIRGILQSVSYSYSAGAAGSSSYSIELAYVRPVDNNEPTVECPIYVEADDRTTNPTPGKVIATPTKDKNEQPDNGVSDVEDDDYETVKVTEMHEEYGTDRPYSFSYSTRYEKREKQK